jgi:hypothetical protein
VDADPGITFSEWFAWADRPQFRRRDGPWLGVYLWGRFDAPPPGTDRPFPELPSQVIYIGESKHLDIRPLSGDHHRLIHYCDTFSDDPDLRKLYLSISRVERFPDGYDTTEAKAHYGRLRVFTQFIEARLYWEYTKRWHSPPALHYKKKRAPKNP